MTIERLYSPTTSPHQTRRRRLTPSPAVRSVSSSLSSTTKPCSNDQRGGDNDGDTIAVTAGTKRNIFHTPSKLPSKKPCLGLPSSTTALSKQPPTAGLYSATSARRHHRGIPSLGDGDRFIPCRRNMSLDLSRLAVSETKKRPHGDDVMTPIQKQFKRHMKSTLCNIPLDKLDQDGEVKALFSFGGPENQTGDTSFPYRAAKFSKMASSTTAAIDPFALDTIRTVKLGELANDGIAASCLASSNKVIRKVFCKPFKTLDAPSIVDDFYLDLISWSKDNFVAVALGTAVYIWHTVTKKTQEVVTLEDSSYVTSVNFCKEPGFTHYIAVGTSESQVMIFDIRVLQKVRTLHGHSGHIYSLAWNGNLLTSAGRDTNILNHDFARDPHIVSKYTGHSQFVCGLAWNDDTVTLASGANDNLVCLWDARISGRPARGSSLLHQFETGLNEHRPRIVLAKHTAAVKALDWCPYHRGILASGGGTADRTIKFWNSANGLLLNSVDSGSQVCSLNWNAHEREIVSSHGYLDNQLIVWKYPAMTKIQELKEHTARVLSTAASPDGNVIVSAGADERLNFWQINQVQPIGKRGGREFSFGGPTIR